MKPSRFFPHLIAILALAAFWAAMYVAPPALAADRLPKGRYQKKCRNCTYADNTLHCECRTGTNYGWSKASLKVPLEGSYFSCNNVDFCGVLTDKHSVVVKEPRFICRDRRLQTCGPEKPPSGDYLKACTGCVHEDALLKCEKCTWKFTGGEASKNNLSLSMKNCSANNPINFYHGRLVCGVLIKNPDPMPTGTFQKTCQDCYMTGAGTLNCTFCRDSRGHAETSSLATRACKEDIANCNGKLTCGSCP